MPSLQNKCLLITGGAGFLGSALVRKLIEERKIPERSIFIPRSKDYDLRKEPNIKRMFNDFPADIVIHLAANCGGIGYNRDNPGTLFYDNLIMGALLMEEARHHKIEKFVAIGTVCMYPKFTPVPFKEENLWNGYPEETNAPYGLAKKMMLVQSQAYRQQFGFNSIFLLPVNLYGPYDHFNINSSHVIPALIKKIYDAQQQGADHIEVWGTGSASREFLYVDDAAEGIIKATENYNGSEPLNIGAGMEITIRDLVNLIAEIMNFKGEIRWDSTKPDGQPRRSLDVSNAYEKLGFKAQTTFRDGLEKTIDWYRKNAE